MTTGSSGGFLLAFLSAFDVGDRVALAAPGYPAYRNILTALGIEPVLLPTEAWSIASSRRRNCWTRPGPARRADRRQPLQSDRHHAVARGPGKSSSNYCEARGIRLISDEIYHGISYGQSARPCRRS